MKLPWLVSAFVIMGFLAVENHGFAQAPADTLLPPGVTAVWDLSQAYREAIPTRERVCLNGLWRWQPAREAATTVPEDNWGFFKVPGAWPGITDYMQKDSQTMFAHPSWRNEKLGGVATAWYQREFEVPAGWGDRRLVLATEYLNSFASVYVDSTKVGELRFPGGEVDLTAVCRPGSKHMLSLLVLAMPLKGVLLSYTDTASARMVKGAVARRGLCGDVYLVGTVPAVRIGDVKVETSVRRGEVTFGVTLREPAAEGHYALRATITRDGHPIAEFKSPMLEANQLSPDRLAFTEKWKPDRLWDLDTPGNVYDLQVSLLDTAGKVLDTAWLERFGFREFWIDGRDFFLNGSRIFLSAVPLDNAQVGAAAATYPAARESLERLKSIGINFVYTHNYDCEPGAHLSFAEILRAADDVGMLVSLSQPHFSHYEWKGAEADQTNGYARHAEFYTRVAQNHPSVICYSMSHNATGYNEDMNPDLIDGLHDPRDTWSSNNAKLALRAEAIVRRLDPGRIVYHHASGNLGVMHDSNFYPNFAPIQELSDWFEHWAKEGVKPAFTCEYGAPFTWDWTMYRGWYQGQREFGSARVPWEFCLAEWNAQFFGDRAFRISDLEKANLRWENKQFQAGSLWHRWDYPGQVGSSRFDERYPVFAMYLTDNWRAFRTWGLSANSPWEFEHFWKPREGVDRGRKALPVAWARLQQPGLSPDYLDQRYERMDLAFERSDWVPTVAAEALMRNNRPRLAYLGGKPAAFTSKDHNFQPGETLEKQVIVLNNSRQTLTAHCEWSCDLPRAVAGSRDITLPTGDQARIPVRIELSANLAPGAYPLRSRVRFGDGETQTDTFTIHVLPRPLSAESAVKIALFDPRGETARELDRLGVGYQRVEANADLAACDALIVGKAALTVDGPAPDIARVREGLKVIVFEQTSAVLEKRFGFRVVEYGLRTVFPRVPDHPLLAGIGGIHLTDWRGEATILSPRLAYEMRPRYGPTVQWCGLPVTRVWRCGNRGNVASVLIEKPVRGDFLPLLDGGYSLQYSPLLEYREGRGSVLFCQVDVTGRTEIDPAAETLTRNILRSLSARNPAPVRTAVYAGDPAGKSHLESTGITLASYDGGNLSTNQVLVVGPGGGAPLNAAAGVIASWLKAGGNLLAIGLDQSGANAFLPFPVTLKNAEHIAAYFIPFPALSPLAGVSPADVHNRGPRELPLVTAGAQVIGDGVLAQALEGRVVFCQLAPWRFDYRKQYNLKRTYRRSSFLVTRLLANLGVAGATPVLARFHAPVTSAKAEFRWLDGLYLDQPEEWDDPYRFFRW